MYLPEKFFVARGVRHEIVGKVYSVSHLCNPLIYGHAEKLEVLGIISCLEFAILNSLYCEVVLKPKQVICLEKVFLNLDVLSVLPTGYGKSLIFHLLPALLYSKKHGASKFNVYISSIIVVVSPLNSLIANQILRLESSGIRATAVDVRSSVEVD